MTFYRIMAIDLDGQPYGGAYRDKANAQRQAEAWRALGWRVYEYYDHAQV